MRDGSILITEDIGIMSEERLLELLTGKRDLAHARRTANAETPVVLACDKLQYANFPTKKNTFHVREGEIVGIYGVVGSGREEIARSLIGFSQPSGGSMSLSGKPFKPRSPFQALSFGVGYLPGNRKEHGILPHRSIRENLTLSSLKRVSWGGLIREEDEKKTASEQLRRLEVKYASIEDTITTLSGGNQQKVLFGRAVARKLKLLVLEDPTAGIDLGAKAELYQRIDEWSRQGLSLLWLSSDIVETLTLCNRVYAMYAGRIVAEFVEPTLADENALLTAILGSATRDTGTDDHEQD
jgi:ribose transport system ATP-binding protein